MLQASQRTALSGPALIRLLALLADADVPESQQSLSDRLSQWLGWTDAIALSSALSGGPPQVAPVARASGGAEEAEATRVRTSLVKAIAGDSVLAPANRRRSGRYAQSHSVAPEAEADFALFRQRYLAIQQSMETAVGNLRGFLRSRLATTTPAMSRLAVLDAVMDRALSERERTLLAAAPGFLAGHFERLRAREETRLAEVGTAGDSPPEASKGTVAVQPGAWLEVFRKDMQSVLLAELDVRFQPVEGLLAALRAC